MSGTDTQHFGGSAGPTGDVQTLANFLSSLYRRDLILKPSIFSIGKSIDSHLQSIVEYAKKVNMSSDADCATILIESLDGKLKNIRFFEPEYEEKQVNLIGLNLN